MAGYLELVETKRLGYYENNFRSREARKIVHLVI